MYKVLTAVTWIARKLVVPCRSHQVAEAACNNGCYTALKVYDLHSGLHKLLFYGVSPFSGIVHVGEASVICLSGQVHCELS